MKKLFALILAITMMATLSVTAFAADYDTAGDKGMTVTYSVSPAYTVTIPETVTIGADGTMVCPLERKNSRNFSLISFEVISVQLN